MGIAAERGSDAWTWTTAADPSAVHRLLCDSDAASATATAPAPQRNPASTEGLVAAGLVQLLRDGGQAIATFTLSAQPPFDPAGIPFSPARTPLYLQRLAVAPEAAARYGGLPGMSALRRAMEWAREGGADVIRCQANPELAGVLGLLAAAGFCEKGPRTCRDGQHIVHLERLL